MFWPQGAECTAVVENYVSVLKQIEIKVENIHTA